MCLSSFIKLNVAIGADVKDDSDTCETGQNLEKKNTEAQFTTEIARGNCQGQAGKNNETVRTALNSHQSPLTPSLGPAPPPCCLAPLSLPGAAWLRCLSAPPAGGHTHTHTKTHVCTALSRGWRDGKYLVGLRKTIDS